MVDLRLVAFVGLDQARGDANLRLDLGGDLRVLVEEGLGVLATLTEPRVSEGVERAGLLQHLVRDPQVHEVGLTTDATVRPMEHHVELGHPEGRRHLVLHDLGTRPAADDPVGVLDLLDAAQFDANRRVELQRPPARRDLGVAEHDSHLLAELVDEDQGGARARDHGSEFAQRLRHQTGLQAHVGIAHVAFDLRARHEGGHAIDHDHIESVAAHEGLGNLERLLTGVGL